LDNNTSSSLLLSIAIAAISALMVACSAGSTLNVQNPPAASNSQALTVAFQPAPPSSLVISGTVQATAIVQNDVNKAGVDWSISCARTGECGSLSSPHTTSGQAVTYSAPASIQGNAETVTITAFATADHTVNVHSRIAVTAFGSILSGTYVIGTSGSDQLFFLPYHRAGVLTLDGNGGVVAGEQTVNFADPNTGLLTSVTDAITGGNYFVGPDGRGSLTINTHDTNIGQNGIETFSLVVLSASRVLLNKFDDQNLEGTSNETSIGTLDLQSSLQAPSLGYAFVANGADTSGNATALGGVFNIDSPLAISGSGSAFDVVSPTLYGPGVFTTSSAVSGNVSPPDTFGAFQVSLATDFGNVRFNAYPIDANRAKLIESDGTFAMTMGDAYNQGAATGTYHKKIDFTGTYAFGIFGRDLSGSTASLSTAGLFSTTGNGTLTTGFIDETQFGDAVQFSDRFTAVYAVGLGTVPAGVPDAAGTGRYFIPPSTVTGFPNFTFSKPANGSGPAWVFYMTTTGGPVLMLDAETEPALASGLVGGGVGTGIAHPVVAGSSFSGSYGIIFSQNLGSESDVVGEITASDNNITSGLLNLGIQQPDDTSLTGSFVTGVIANRLHGTMSDDNFGTLQMALYPIDPSQGFFIERDLSSGLGLTFGYYSARTPVCQGCP
jgi:hypothetical protein